MKPVPPRISSCSRFTAIGQYRLARGPAAVMKVLVFSNDQIGTVMAGPGIRSFEFARALAGDFDVTLMAPGGSPTAPEGVSIADSAGLDPEALGERLGDFDVVVTQFLPLQAARAL